MNGIRGKTAIVTGATSGIGRRLRTSPPHDLNNVYNATKFAVYGLNEAMNIDLVVIGTDQRSATVVNKVGG